MQKQTLKSKLTQLHPIQLGYLNTPLDPLPRLSKALGGPELWAKRDDLTGLATGGNKVRKLNFVLADALAHKPDLVLTAGGLQSNQARQTAAACSILGMPCTLVLAGEEPRNTPRVTICWTSWWMPVLSGQAIPRSRRRWKMKLPDKGLPGKTPMW